MSRAISPQALARQRDGVPDAAQKSGPTRSFFDARTCKAGALHSQLSIMILSEVMKMQVPSFSGSNMKALPRQSAQRGLSRARRIRGRIQNERRPSGENLLTAAPDSTIRVVLLIFS